MKNKMSERFTIIQEYDIDGNCEDAYYDSKTCKSYSFCDETADTRFLKDINKICDENEQLKKEKEIIKEKLLKYIIEYHKISNDNWNMGLRESVEGMQDEVEALFKNPIGWEYYFDCDDCTQYQEIKDNLDKGHCRKHNKEVNCYMEGCEDFEWK